MPYHFSAEVALVLVALALVGLAVCCWPERKAR